MIYYEPVHLQGLISGLSSVCSSIKQKRQTCVDLLPFPLLGSSAMFMTKVSGLKEPDLTIEGES